MPSWPHRAPPFFSVPLVWFPPRAFAAALDDFRPDIIHWVGDGWFWGHLWTWFYGRRRAAIVFTPSFHRLIPAYRWLQPINIFLCRAADRITALSDRERRALSAHLPGPARAPDDDRLGDRRARVGRRTAAGGGNRTGSRSSASGGSARTRGKNGPSTASSPRARGSRRGSPRACASSSSGVTRGARGRCARGSRGKDWASWSC